MGVIKDILRTMDYGPAPEGAEQVTAWLEEHKNGFGHFINGAFSKPSELFDVFNPATAKRIARVSQGSAADIDAAVAAARKALPKWAALSPFERSKHLYALARHVQKRERFLVGPGDDRQRQADPRIARHRHSAGGAPFLSSRRLGLADRERVSGHEAGRRVRADHPVEFPAADARLEDRARARGGEYGRLEAGGIHALDRARFRRDLSRDGLPPGVVNIVTGDGSTGAALVEHQGVDKIAFTGSTEVGRAIRKATAGTGKKLSLELGGKSPFVVFEDADLDSAVEGVVDAIWFNQGQVCCAGSRLLVAESVAEALYAKLRARMGRLRVGDPLDKSTDIGAIVAPVQLERIRRLMREGEAEGLEFFRADDSVPDQGCFYPPTLVTGVEPASVLAREEIFGPVLVAQTFRTPDEAVALANNTRYGLAASVWTENVNRALEVAARIKAGVVWINSTNMFDAASGFGGYRESGFGREGGREGLYEYRAVDEPKSKPAASRPPRLAAAPGFAPARNIAEGDIDRTAKMYVGGKQARPDSGYSYAVLDPAGREVGLAGLGNRKDIRNAVEAAAKASAWGAATAHNRAQVLYYVAENLAAREAEFARRLSAMTGAPARAAKAEVEASIRRAFYYAGYADKFDGAVHATRSRFVTIAMNEPWGVMGVVCPNEAPLIAFISLVMPAIAMGNCVVAIPSASHPLSATDLYSVLDTSDVPAGVVNIVTGEANALAKTLAEHDGVDALWYVGDADGAAEVEALSAGNLKATWTCVPAVDWTKAEGREFLRRATQVKNIWTPYGE